MSILIMKKKLFGLPDYQCLLNLEALYIYPRCSEYLSK